MPFAGLLVEGVRAPSPGVCICCGNDRRPLATTGHEIPGYGTVLVCVGTTAKPGCLLQLAVRMGCLLPGKAHDLELENERLQQQNDVLSQLLQRRKMVDPKIEVVPVQEVVDMLSERLGLTDQVTVK